MYPHFHTISNIYSNPDKEREKALAYDYPQINTLNASPGKTVHTTFDPTSESYVRIKEYFDSIGKVFKIKSHSYRVATSTDFYNSYVHTDNATYQVIISLSPDHCEHHEFEHYYASEIVNKVCFHRNKCDPSLRDATEYVHQHEDDMTIAGSEFIEFNKAIFIECCHWHAPSHGLFGANAATARLMEIYTIDILSDYKHDFYPYVWYYENVLTEEECNEIVDIMKDNQYQYEHYEKIAVGNIIINYKNNLTHKLIRSHLDHIVDSYPDLQSMFLLHKTSLHIETKAEYMPKQYKTDWSMDSSNKNYSFTAIYHLHEHPIGISIYNPFKKETVTIPTKTGSLLIFPRSWMYPVKQHNIGDHVKYILYNAISFM